MSESLRKKLLRYELTGRGFDLRMKDIFTPDTLKMQMTGELYAALQGKLEEIANYTSLDFMRVLLKSPNLPMSTRLEVAKEMLPYEHPRNPTPPPREGEYRAALILPGVVSVEDWEREAAKHRERIKKLEEEH